MSVLYGLYKPTEGEIVVDGKAVEIDSPATAIELGIGMVHQHFMLVPVMTVAENIVLGQEPQRAGGLLDLAAARARVRELSDRYGLAVDPDAVIEDVTVGAQQRVEILRALYRGARILVLDEPTAVLTAQEVRRADRRAAAPQAGRHRDRLHQPQARTRCCEVADRITVLRRGKRIDTVPREGATERSLARLVVGRDVLLRGRQDRRPRSASRCWTSRISTSATTASCEAVDGLSLTVRAGEIVALAGVDGNGQQELVEAITGLRSPSRAACVVGGRGHRRPRRARRDRGRGSRTSPRTASAAGSCCRSRWPRTWRCASTARPAFSARGWLRLQPHAASAPGGCCRSSTSAAAAPRRSRRRCRAATSRRCASPARSRRTRRCSIAHQPTRGLDVGAIEFVHRRLIAERDTGRAVLLVSLEYEEVRSLADRILVIYEGRIVGEFPPDATEEKLGIAMTGGQTSGGGGVSGA